MLQRPQTLLLLGALLLNVLLFSGPLAIFTSDGIDYLMRHSGLVTAAGEKLELATWPMTTLVVLVSVLSFGTIFSYKNRMRQMRLCSFLLLLSLGLFGMFFYYAWVAGGILEEAHRVYQWRFILPPVNAVLFYLAFRRIRRDDLMVKAFDRIR